MSSFFRPASEISESEDVSYSRDSSASQRSITKPAELASHQRGESVHELVAQSSVPSIASQHHQNVLVHALLEEKCLNDVWHELNANDPGSPYTREDPHVRSLATERYRALTEQLSSHGLLTSGLESDNFRHVRQTARDGLSLLSQQLNALDLSGQEDSTQGAADNRLIRQPLRRLLTDTTGPNTAHGLVLPTSASLPSTQSPLASQLLPSHPLLDSTRYVRDFEEVCMLGKGGYGSVFQCNHRLDGRSYAVKKITLGPSVLARVQHRGEGELNSILGELRIMARLEHPNIVRYFGGWVEWSKASDTGHPSPSEQPRLITYGSSVTATSEASSFHGHDQPLIQFEASAGASNGDIVMFEDSVSHEEGNNLGEPALSTSPLQAELRRTHTRSTLATVTDDSDVEQISRQSPIAEPSYTTSEPVPANDSGLSLTLHIQMSLYPLTLSHYLSTSTTIPLDNSHLTLRHCYHLPASINLMFAILDGVSHLHANGIIHRDLKPANIFLSPTICTASTVPVGSIDPLACPDCLSASPSPPSPPCSTSGPKSQRLQMGVCVGDFGLVSTLNSADSSQAPQASSSVSDIPSSYPASTGQNSNPKYNIKQVGTELYRPTQPHPDQLQTGMAHVSQDIYALGIIFTELLCKFDTRMERHDVLSALRGEERLPGVLKGEGRMGRAGEVVGRMMGVVRGEEGEVGCEEVKGWLRDLLDG
ncbi:putative eukaryotic translation initiation factor 2-alpha kinase 1 [Elsinoe australis]|uniref:Putative eukaryotic translation initiation factor 2-alpha kinase 1 n=1 Tax=Elsinoe australis TaxID=40998 RepID=A0A4U7ANT4_9PEZI|nr:putative eukaryotic translation initiation factor 2-alpha kinase 1 [Elsinoe australis]